MSYKLRLDIKSENGNYMLQDVTDKGYVNNTIEVTSEELPQLMSELCELSGEKDLMLDALRDVYQMFEPKSIEFKVRES